MTATMMWKIMDGEDLQECYGLNTMLLNCRSVVVYSLLSFTPVDYVKSSVLMLGSVLKPIISILHVLIKLNYVLIAIMDFKMQLEQGLRTIPRDWAVESFFLHPSPAPLDT